MTDAKFMTSCALCSTPIQMGVHRYEGKYIPKYKLTVCATCYGANWDGWAPVYEDKIIEHLQDKGLPVPERNAKGWLPRD